MSAYKSFAVIGGGTAGLAIVGALAAQNISVVLLSRPGSSAKAVPAGVGVVQVDFSNAAAVAEVFKRYEVDVVLPTITTLAAADQKPLVDAAKLAAVKLFVPSEYGPPTEGQTEGVQGAKDQIAAYLKSATIPSLRVYTGIWTEIIPWLAGYTEHGKIRFVGKGEAPVSFTSVADIAGFLAFVLTTLPPSELEDHVFRIEGERGSMNGLGALFKTSVEHIPAEDGESRVVLWDIIDRGAASTGWDETNKAEGSGPKAAGSSNALWPGHHWKTIKEVHNL
ncbi:NmrA domain-containing protein [Mycena venus]|uniref:NmrA domain-containing protein n=1 Tax=Mycena venus TaxID=2733690 RepID=A0A8H6YDK7_9AGAR|nr:NmrA domain-containing protein [Mycena venus]